MPSTGRTGLLRISRLGIHLLVFFFFYRGFLILSFFYGVIDFHRNGHADCLRVLLANGADVNRVNLLQQTPLHIAAAFDYSEAIDTLLRANADPNARDLKVAEGFFCQSRGDMCAFGTSLHLQGRTPLHLAAHASASEAIDMLASADANARDTLGRSPLHLAALKGSLDCVEALLQRQSAIDARDAKVGFKKEIERVLTR